MTDETPPPYSTPDPTPWQHNAEMYARNADYWRERAERAERTYPPHYWWAFRRWVRNHITARVDWSKP